MYEEILNQHLIPRKSLINVAIIKIAITTIIVTIFCILLSIVNMQ